MESSNVYLNMVLGYLVARKVEKFKISHGVAYIKYWYYVYIDVYTLKSEKGLFFFFLEISQEFVYLKSKMKRN